MFEQTFVHSAGEVRNPWSLAASFSGQVLLVGAVLTVPLLQTARIAFRPPVILYNPPRPTPPPVKVEVRNKTAQPAVASIRRAVFRPELTARTIPTRIVTTGGEDLSQFPIITSNPALGGIGLEFPNANTIAVAPPKTEPIPVKSNPTSIRTSTGVQQAMLLHEVKPIYPQLARSARISGTVRIAAIIARDGTIQHLQLISGPPLLVKAAIDAVQQWRYKPTLLSGEPVEVITEIDVNFTLSN